jgi:AGZA family xanthine/uracil permease-like MFS transporter
MPTKTALTTEILAGFTTFFTMAYIVVVNPMMLSHAGMDYNAVFVATCLSAAFGCIAMGLLANYPIALAPSMSLNAYFSFYVVQQLHFPWQAALGIVFLAGLLFAILTGTQLRQWLIYAMPQSLKMAIAAGIGLFLVAIALKSLNMKLNNHAASFTNIKIWLCLLGVLIAVILDRLRIMGAILIAMVVITLLGSFFHLVHLEGILSAPPSMGSTFMQLQIPAFNNIQAVVTILIFLFVTLFDNTGTLIAILHQAKLLPKDRHDLKAKRLNKALFADSLAAMFGAFMGTSSTGSYIESAAGVRAGGRTGLTSIVVGILFLCALFFAPLAKAIPDYAAAAALIYVGMLMTTNILSIHWRDFTESFPAMLCVCLIPITFSIADGISMGFISYVLLKTVAGKRHELSTGIWLIAGLCALYLVVRV